MSLRHQHSFWGSLSPLGGLTGAGILIMASARLSWAITIAGSLFWVFTLTSLSYNFLLSAIGKKFFPVQGRSAVYTCLSAFFGSTYLLMFWLICPFAAFETFMLLLLVPLFCAQIGITGSSILEISSDNSSDNLEQSESLHQAQNKNPDILECVSESFSQAATLAFLTIAFSIVR